MGFKDLKCDFNYKDISPEIIEYCRQQSKEHHVMFNILDKLYNSEKDENENLALDKLHKLIGELHSKKEFDIQKDLVNDITKNEKLIRSLTDIVSENNVPKKELKVTEINLSSNILVKEVEQNMSFFQIIPTDIEYHLMVKSTEDISENFREKAVVWDINEELQLKSSDLIILRDTQELWKLSLENLMKQLIESISGNGFLLTVARFKFTEPEMALKSVLNGRKVINNSDLEIRIKEIVKTAEQLGLHLISSKSDTIGSNGSTLQKN